MWGPRRADAYGVVSLPVSGGQFRDSAEGIHDGVVACPWPGLHMKLSGFSMPVVCVMIYNGNMFVLTMIGRGGSSRRRGSKWND